MTPNTPIRDADNGWKLLGITNPRDMTYMHSYGGEAPFFEALSQGKLLATRCDNPKCEYRGSVYQPFRIHCPDCLRRNTVIDMTDIAKKSARIHTFMVWRTVGGVQHPDKPIKFINIEFDGVVTILMSYLSLGDPAMECAWCPYSRSRVPPTPFSTFRGCRRVQRKPVAGGIFVLKSPGRGE
jgi:uncharacterized OB-fold protein